MPVLRLVGGHWIAPERLLHINALELLAVKLSLLELRKNASDKHIQVRSDSQTAVAYINDVGGCRSRVINDIA